MTYHPGQPSGVDSIDSLLAYVQRELTALSQELAETTVLESRSISAPPTKPRDGMIAHADGTNWNPGSGAGAYVFQGGVWVPMSTNQAGTVTNAMLSGMLTHTIKANNTGGTTNPQDVGLSAVLDFIGAAVSGDILYRDAAWARLPKAADGTILTLAAGLPSWAAQLVAATKAQEQAAAILTAFTSPQQQHQHPSAAKAWVQWTQSGTTVTVNASYNVTSVVRNGVGDYSITFTNAFANANYAIAGMCRKTASNNALWLAIDRVNAPTASVLRVDAASDVGANEEVTMGSVVVFGTLA